MSAAGLALQKAVYDRLTAQLTPTKTYDHVPQGVTFPYVTIGEDTAVDASTMPAPGSSGASSGDGEEVTLTIHAWSRLPGRKECKELLAAIKAALQHQNLTVTGHNLVLLRFEFSETFMDEDGVTRHGVTRFRALLNNP